MQVGVEKPFDLQAEAREDLMRGDDDRFAKPLSLHCRTKDKKKEKYKYNNHKRWDGKGFTEKDG